MQEKTLGSLDGEIVYTIDATKDLLKELIPQLKKLVEELNPTLNALRQNLDKHETLLLIQKLTENTETFLKLINTLEATQHLIEELTPGLKALTEELNPTLNALRQNLDKDETVLLLQKLTENTDTFLKLINALEATRQLTEELLPNLKLLMEELTPRMNTIRTLLDEDDTWVIIEHLLSLKKPIIKYMEALMRIEEMGYRDMTLLDTTLDFLVKFSIISNQPAFQNFWSAVVESIHEMNEVEIKKVSTLGLMSVMRDEDFQKGMGAMITFLKLLGKRVR